MPAPDDQQPSRHSARTVRTQRSAYALALGVCTGVTSASAPSEANTSSKLRQNFVSRSRITKPTRRPRSPRAGGRLRACWATQRPGVGGRADQVDSPGVQLDEEQHVQAPQPHGVDGEEVTGDDPGGLLAQKRPPGRGGPPWCRVEPVTAQRRSDRSFGDLHAKPLELAFDALVPQRGFSLASRTISGCTCVSSGGRPVWRCG